MLVSPHGNLDKYVGRYLDFVREDPDFFLRFGEWYLANGEVRDILHMWIAAGFQHPEVKFRNMVAGVMARLPHDRVYKVSKYMADSHLVKVNSTFRGWVIRYVKSVQSDRDPYTQKDRPGLFVHRIGLDPHKMRWLYRYFHIRPEGKHSRNVRLAKAFLEGKVVRDTTRYAVSLLLEATSDQERVGIILQYHIPFRVLKGVIRELSEPVLRAVIREMSPQELITGMTYLEKSPAFDNVQDLIVEKLEKYKKGRVSTLKAGVAAEHVKSEKIKRQLRRAEAERIRERGIKVPWAMIVDKSGSMHRSIERAKYDAAVLATMTDAPFVVMAVDFRARVIGTQKTLRGKTRDQIEALFDNLRANGATGYGAAFRMLAGMGFAARKVIVVGDGGTWYGDAVKDMRHYARVVDMAPEIIHVHLPGEPNYFENIVRRLGWSYTLLKANNADYYSVADLIALVANDKTMDLVEAILATPYPNPPVRL